MEFIQDFENADTISIDTIALEEIVQQEREREISQLNTLSEKVSYLHTSLLYYRNSKSKMGVTCYDAWRMLIKKVGGTSNGWRELGHALGISQDDLDYISNSVRGEPADMVLKVFMQNEKATLDKIVDVFVKMKRYDILKAVEGPFSNLVQCFIREDSGYHSNSNCGKKEIISMKNCPNDLPAALNKCYIAKDKNPDKPEELILPPKKVEKIIRNDNPILFLTFTEDGAQTAVNIQNYVKNWVEIPGVTVITLTSRKDEVYQNPEKFIREYFEKAVFVVPIITAGYLDKIRSNIVAIPSTTDNLDYKYVTFIYNLIINQYIHASGCLNKKVRSVLPQNTDMNLLRSISMYPDLLPWTFESNFDEQFKAFLSKEYS